MLSYLITNMSRLSSALVSASIALGSIGCSDKPVHNNSLVNELIERPFDPVELHREAFFECINEALDTFESKVDQENFIISSLITTFDYADLISLFENDLEFQNIKRSPRFVKCLSGYSGKFELVIFELVNSIKFDEIYVNGRFNYDNLRLVSSINFELNAEINRSKDEAYVERLNGLKILLEEQIKKVYKEAEFTSLNDIKSFYTSFIEILSDDLVILSESDQTPYYNLLNRLASSDTFENEDVSEVANLFGYFERRKNLPQEVYRKIELIIDNLSISILRGDLSGGDFDIVPSLDRILKSKVTFGMNKRNLEIALVHYANEFLDVYFDTLFSKCSNSEKVINDESDLTSFDANLAFHILKAYGNGYKNISNINKRIKLILSGASFTNVDSLSGCYPDTDEKIQAVIDLMKNPKVSNSDKDKVKEGQKGIFLEKINVFFVGHGKFSLYKSNRNLIDLGLKFFDVGVFDQEFKLQVLEAIGNEIKNSDFTILDYKTGLGLLKDLGIKPDSGFVSYYDCFDWESNEIMDIDYMSMIEILRELKKDPYYDDEFVSYVQIDFYKTIISQIENMKKVEPSKDKLVNDMRDLVFDHYENMANYFYSFGN